MKRYREPFQWVERFCTCLTFGKDIHETGTARASLVREEGRHLMTVNVRYLVLDVDEAITFYTHQLGFSVEMHPGPGFARLSRGDLHLLLNAVGGSGGAAQAMPDGRHPEPGGWNRIQIEVEDLTSLVETLHKDGAHFRNEIVSGNGGKQILLEDPSGNPIELFEPYRSSPASERI